MILFITPQSYSFSPKVYRLWSIVCGLLIMFLFFLFICPTYAATYSMYDVMGVDAAASAWLLKRHVDPEAQFKFYPKGDLIAEGIPLDTPEAEFRRVNNKAAFEVIVDKFQIIDPKIIKLSEMIHQIEINYWAGELDPETDALNETIKEILKSEQDPHKILKQIFHVLDEEYAKD